MTKSRIADYEASITLPKSISDRLTGRGRLEAGLFLSYYDTAAMFPLSHNTTQLPEGNLASHLELSSVVAATFAGEELHSLEDDVIITFKLEFETVSNLTCVSWDFAADGKDLDQKIWTVLHSWCILFALFTEGHGNWVEDGCELVSYEDGEATCACSHLTNYACLVESSATNEPIEPRVVNTLSILSIVGVGISILSLTFTIAALLVFG